MRKHLQFNEAPETYYAKLWKVDPSWIKDLLEIYKWNSEIWKYRHFKKWFQQSYNFTITYRQWRHFIRYVKFYKRRMDLKLPKNIQVTWS